MKVAARSAQYSISWLPPRRGFACIAFAPTRCTTTGDPLEVLLLHPDGSGAVQTVGSDLASGARPQLFIPGGTFHVSRLRAGGSYSLLGTTEWPGVEPPDVELGDRDHLIATHPAFRDEIIDFTK